MGYWINSFTLKDGKVIELVKCNGTPDNYTYTSLGNWILGPRGYLGIHEVKGGYGYEVRNTGGAYPDGIWIRFFDSVGDIWAMFGMNSDFDYYGALYVDDVAMVVSVCYVVISGNKELTRGLYPINYVDSRVRMYNWALGVIPITYNYKPIDYIFGNGSTLKLSMIKEASTNNGKDVEFTSPTGIQRFTDKTNLHSILKSMPLNGTKILGYTDNNNYVTLSKTRDSTGNLDGVIKYYIDNVHQSSLDFEIYMLSGNPDTEFHYYLSYLVDTEKKACRQSLITIHLNNSSGSYNSEENFRSIVTEEYQTLMFEWLSTGYFTESSDDPNEQGGTSKPGGGNGGYNNIGDDILFPTKPSVSTVDADFITVYNPTLAQIKSLARYMWSGDFNLDSFKKIFTDPMDCIIGLHMLPCPIPINGAQNVKVGNLLSPVIMNLAANQFVDVDCGSIKINEYWGSYLDYSPYTKIIIYLPYIGTQPLEVDDVMNKTVNVKYRVDIVTGSCVCFIIVNGVVLYQFSGSCIATIPITSQDYKNVLTNIVSIGIAGAGVASSIIATGGVSTPVAAGAAYVAANGVMSNKPTIAHGNSASGTAGFMSIQTPYITITRAKQCLPKSQNAFTGYPSYTTKKLSTLTGFTQVEEIQLSSLSCTDGERKEIETLLKGGVII